MIFLSETTIESRTFKVSIQTYIWSNKLSIKFLETGFRFSFFFLLVSQLGSLVVH